MVNTFDKQFVDMWIENVIEPNRLEGTWDVDARFEEMARGGLAAEVIFPDFGIPFELYSQFACVEQLPPHPRAASGLVLRLNRWLVDFCSTTPERFAGMALIDFKDVEAAVAEIRWAKDAGLKGICLPTFSAEFPVYHPDFEPIWSALEDLEMPVNSHSAITGTFEFGLLPTGIDEYFPPMPPIPHPSVVPAIIQKPSSTSSTRS